MASVVAGFTLPHDPLIVSDPKAPAPAKAKVVHDAFAHIERRLRELAVDTVVVLASDHYGLYGPHCVPQCLIGTGDVEGPMEAWLGVAAATIENNEPLAQHILNHGHHAGIDWAFAKSMVVDHSTMVPYHFCIRSHAGVRTIPVYLNNAVAPFLPGRRAFELGRALRNAIESWGGNERVAIFGTGGISHWVGSREMGRVNEEFDQRILGLMKNGDIDALVAIPDEEILAQGGNGALEIRNWICAFAAVPNARCELIAYVAIPEWISGLGFMELKTAA
jgi:protocatechuate 4,5-dioxygenase beta chain